MGIGTEGTDARTSHRQFPATGNSGRGALEATKSSLNAWLPKLVLKKMKAMYTQLQLMRMAHGGYKFQLSFNFSFNRTKYSCAWVFQIDVLSSPLNNHWDLEICFHKFIKG